MLADLLYRTYNARDFLVESPLGDRVRLDFTAHFRNIPAHLLRFNASLPPAPAPWTPAVGDKVRLRDPRPSGVWTGGEVDTVLPEYILVRWGDGIRSAEDASALELVPAGESSIDESDSAPEEELDAEGFIIPKTDNSTTFTAPFRVRDLYSLPTRRAP